MARLSNSSGWVGARFGGRKHGGWLGVVVLLLVGQAEGLHC